LTREDVRGATAKIAAVALGENETHPTYVIVGKAGVYVVKTSI
jgi:hypothetical protein